MSAKDLKVAMDAIRQLDARNRIPGLAFEGWKGSRIHPWCFGSALRRARAALQPRLDTQKVDFEGVQPSPEAKVPEGWQGSRLFEAAKAMPSSVLVDGGPVERRWTEPTLSKAQLVEAHAEVLKHYMMERRADASGYRVGFAREVLNRVIDALTASHAGEGKPE